MPFPLPHPTPFQRLSIQDGLLMTAELWEQAHDYHRQRQNFLFQALFQPGIVWGLGVAVVEAPAQVEAVYRDRRWVQIQPGVALDRLGNPIVVPEPEWFRVQSDPPVGDVKTVFLVVRYSDPKDRTPDPTQGGSLESFTLVETTSPGPNDVELCRIVLTPGRDFLSPASDPFAPGYNQLDLRYRRQAHLRAPRSLQPVVIQGEGVAVDLSALPHLVTGYAPTLALAAPVVITPGDWATVPTSVPDPQDWDWVYLPATLAPTLPAIALAQLNTYLAQGGVLLVELSLHGTSLQALYPLLGELTAALAPAAPEPPPDLRQSLIQELQAVQRDVETQLQALIQTLAPFAQAIGCPLSGPGHLGPEHPLTHTPFWFGLWPSVEGYPLTLRAWGGLVVIVGAIAPAWQRTTCQAYSRETLRSLHELTVNLLQFSRDRRHWHRLQTPLPPPPAAPPPTSSPPPRPDPLSRLADL